MDWLGGVSNSYVRRGLEFCEPGRSNKGGTAKDGEEVRFSKVKIPVKVFSFAIHFMGLFGRSLW